MTLPALTIKLSDLVTIKLIISCMGIDSNFHTALQRLHPLKMRNNYSAFVILLIWPGLYSYIAKALVLYKVKKNPSHSKKCMTQSNEWPGNMMRALR